jgi:DNA-binding NtrC family response regulator
LKILLADDDRSLRRVLQFKLEKHGFHVTAVGNGSEALRELESRPFDLLLSDIRMPGMDGLELLERARSIVSDLKVILITAHATVSQAVLAVKLGAFDYVTKPFEDDELLLTINKALRYTQLEKENRELKGKLEASQQAPQLIGVSSAFKNLILLIDKIAPSDATVLITGPSGTGKELVARRIHAKSGRSGRDFIAVNCAAIPVNLIESELFGHVKGAFTGAIRNKRGKFELADGGTIFLDEISELAVDLQAKLLRVLQERVIEPVGSEKHLEVDVRVLAATNTNLESRVADNTFREDLFYRLNVIPLDIPPLATRRDDVPVLVQRFVKRFAGADTVVVSPDLLQKLVEYDWPGNVRELENLIERMVVLRSSDRLTPQDLPPGFGSAPSQVSGTAHLTYPQAEEKLVREALEKSAWNRSRAARQLDIPRHVLLYRMKKYGITAPSD